MYIRTIGVVAELKTLLNSRKDKDYHLLIFGFFIFMEIFKQIKDYKDYQVSNLGRVKSMKFEKEKILKQTKNSGGYFTVNLFNGKGRKTFKVHQLVAIYFLNHIPNFYDLVVNHIDFNKGNNNIKNLEIVTNRENTNKKHIKHTSKYTGVSWHNQRKKWISRIYVNGIERYLGIFVNEKDASEAYEKALIKTKKHKL